MSTLSKHLKEQEGRRFMTKWWVPIALAMSLAAAPAMACQTFPQDLGEPYQEEALLNGLYLVEYDRDGDGRPDYAVLFQIVGQRRCRTRSSIGSTLATAAATTRRGSIRWARGSVRI